MYNYLLMFCNRIQSKERSAQPFCVVDGKVVKCEFIMGMNGAFSMAAKTHPPDAALGHPLSSAAQERGA
jgi:hypothetical protein